MGNGRRKQREVSDPGYMPDGVGNRKQVIRDGQTETYVTNSVNEYVYVNNQRLIYDANGNLTGWNGKTLHYNHNNQLVQVDMGDDTYAFRYDALGRKLAGKVKLFGLWFWRCGWHDGQHVIMEETLGVMPAERWYVYGVGIDEMLVMWWSMNGGWMQVWRSDDALGSTYVLSDDAEDVVEVYGYDIYGQPSFYDGSGVRIDASVYGNRYLFTGRQWHPVLSLYYYRARWYSPALGRFLQRDPLESLSFQYCDSAPVTMVDPKGLQPGPKKCRFKIYKLSLRANPDASDIPVPLKNRLKKEYEIVDKRQCSLLEVMEAFNDPSGVAYIIEGEYLLLAPGAFDNHPVKSLFARANRWYIYTTYGFGATEQARKGRKPLSPVSRFVACTLYSYWLWAYVFLARDRIAAVVVASCYSGGYDVSKPQPKEDLTDLLSMWFPTSKEVTIFTFSNAPTAVAQVQIAEGRRIKVTQQGVLSEFKELQVFTWRVRLEKGDVERHVYESGWLEKALKKKPPK